MIPHYIFLVMIWMSIYGLVAFPISVLVMHLLMPKKVMQVYFREPHFSPTEQVMFSAFPFVFMRVTGMIWLIALPRFGRKRQMMDIQTHCPGWYVRLSQFFIFFYFVFFGLLVGLLVILLLYAWLTT